MVRNIITNLKLINSNIRNEDEANNENKEHEEHDVKED
jgi:hypothetical protein